MTQSQPQPERSDPRCLGGLDRRGKELLRTIAGAQAVLLAANKEFEVVFRQLCAQLPERRTSRPQKAESFDPNIYEWCEEAERETGAQIHWLGLIKQFRAAKRKEVRTPDSCEGEN